MKTCKKCGLEKSADEFYKEKRVKDGLQARCIECCKADAKAVFEANPEPARKRAREVDPVKVRWQRLKRKYGITQQEYEQMLESQEYKCAICGTHDCGHNETPNLLVDHDHETNEVRGLLCSSCNLMLGKAQDSIDILSRAITYLKPQYA